MALVPPGTDISKNPLAKPTAQPVAAPPQQNGPTQPPAPQSGGSSGTDFYTQALSLLQPSTQAQVTPLQSILSSLPDTYKKIAEGIQKNVDTIQASGEAQKQSLADQAKVGSQQIRTQGIAQLGANRAANAGKGFASTSGVEQSQEGNINQGIAATLYNLDRSVADETTKITAMTNEQIQPLLNQIAQLPQEEQNAAWQLGSTIAQAIGHGSATALQFAGTMANTAIQAQKLGLDAESAKAAIVNDLIALSQKATPVQSTTAKGSTLFGIQMPAGEETTTTTPGSINPAVATQLQDLLQSLLGGGTGSTSDSGGGGWQ